MLAKYMGYNSEGKRGGGRKEFSIFFPFALLELEGGKNKMLNTAKETKKMQSLFSLKLKEFFFLDLDCLARPFSFPFRRSFFRFSCSPTFSRPAWQD